MKILCTYANQDGSVWDSQKEEVASVITWKPYEFASVLLRTWDTVWETPDYILLYRLKRYLYHICQVVLCFQKIN